MQHILIRNLLEYWGKLAQTTRANGGVIQEAAQKRHRKRNPHLGGTDCFGIAKQVVYQQIHTAGVMDASRHHKHGDNGDKTTVTETGQGLVGRDNTADTEHHKHTHHNQMGRKSP